MKEYVSQIIIIVERIYSQLVLSTYSISGDKGSKITKCGIRLLATVIYIEMLIYSRH